MKKKPWQYQSAILVIIVSLFMSGCPEEPKKPEQEGPLPPTYTEIARSVFLGGSVLYVADPPTSGHLVPGVSVGVRLGKVDFDQTLTGEETEVSGPVFAEKADSTRYGYITVETVDTNGIRFKYTEYTADGKSSVVKGYHTLAVGEEKDISGDGIPDISYTPPEFTRAGFQKAVTLNFLSSPESDKLNTTMFTVLTNQYANKEYPSGIIGINPEGTFIVSKFTSNGSRAAVRGIETGDLMIDGVNYGYQQVKGNGEAYRSARAVNDSDLEDISESPDLFFPLMSIDFKYEVDEADLAPESRAAAPTLADFQKEQTRIRKVFAGYTQVIKVPVNYGNVAGNLSLGVNFTKKNVWGTFELTTSVVTLVDVELKPITSVSASMSLIGGPKDLLKNVKIPPIGTNVFWVEIKPSLLLDCLLTLSAEYNLPNIRGGFTGLYGETMTVGANYGVAINYKKVLFVKVPTGISASFTAYKSSSAIKETASYITLDRPAGGPSATITVTVEPSLAAEVQVKATVGASAGLASIGVGPYGTIGFKVSVPDELRLDIGSTVSVSRTRKLALEAYFKSGVDFSAKLAGATLFNKSIDFGKVTFWNKTDTLFSLTYTF